MATVPNRIRLENIFSAHCMPEGIMEDSGTGSEQKWRLFIKMICTTEEGIVPPVEKISEKGGLSSAVSPPSCAPTHLHESTDEEPERREGCGSQSPQQRHLRPDRP